MTTTDDFSNPLASSDGGPEPDAPDASASAVAPEADATPDETPAPEAGDVAAEVSGEGPDGALVVGVRPAEAVELPGGAKILDVTALCEADHEIVEAEP